MRQESFARLWDGFDTDKAAMQARNRRLRELRKQGVRCFGSAMPNQVRKYAGFGQPDGRSCTVYQITIMEN